MKNERLYQEFIFNKFKDDSVSSRDNKLRLMTDCQKFQVNYTNIYVKIVNYQIYTYGIQLGDTSIMTHRREDCRKMQQNKVHRDRYNKNRDYLNRVASERYSID